MATIPNLSTAPPESAAVAINLPNEGEGDGIRIYAYGDYERNVRIWDFMHLSYRAGSEYKSGVDSEGADVFQGHNKENTERSEQRRRRSSVPSYARFFVQRFDGYVANSQVSGRDWGNAQWEAWSGNVSGETKKTPWTSFMRTFHHAALKASPAWARIDAPTFNRSAINTLADQEAAGIQLVASLLDPRNVVDYDIEPKTGETLRIVIREWHRSKASAMSKETWEATFTEWTKDQIRTYVQTDARDELGRARPQPFKVTGGTTQVNKYGLIPFVPLHFFDADKENLMFSQSMIHDVCDWQRDIYRIGSLLDEEVFNRTFTTQVIFGAEAEEITKQRGATLIAFRNEKGHLEKMGSDTEQTKSLLEVMHFKLRNLFRSAQFESSGDTKESRTAESGEKKSRDLEGLYTAVRGFVERCEAAENQLREVWARMMKITEEVPIVNYARDFDQRTIEEDVTALNEMIIAEFPATFTKLYRERIIRKMMPVLGSDTIKEIKSELDDIKDREQDEQEKPPEPPPIPGVTNGPAAQGKPGPSGTPPAAAPSKGLGSKVS
ncbi:MAG: hypothetical protein ACI88C_000059 [Acidimicrobiales bacterium]|jgi:hypothetical protein